MDSSTLYEWARTFAYIVFDPFLQICVLFFLSFVVVIFAPKKRYRSLGLIFSTLYFLILTTPWVPNLLIHLLQSQYPPLTDQSSKQAVVILNGGILLFDQTSKQFSWGGSFSRAGEALRIVKKGQAYYLIISGGTPYAHEGFEEEGASIKRLAKEWGITEDRILLENESKTTAEHPIKLKKLFEKYGIKNFYLVTSATHMLRAMLVFESQGLTPTAYPVEFTPTQEKWGFGMQYISRMKTALHEIFGLLGYWHSDKI